MELFYLFLFQISYLVVSEKCRSIACSNTFVSGWQIFRTAPKPREESFYIVLKYHNIHHPVLVAMQSKLHLRLPRQVFSLSTYH